MPATVPPQREQPETAAQGQDPNGSADAPESTAIAAATQRVRLIIEGADDPDETERAIEALTSQPGWKVRPVEPRDGMRVRSGNTVLIVDALAYGQRWTAVSAVREQAAGLLKKPPIGFRVREARLIQHEEDRNEVLVRVVRRVRPDSGRFRRWLRRHWEAAGGADTGHVLAVRFEPEETSEQLKVRVKEQWADLAQGGVAFDDRLHDLRLSIGRRPRSESETPETQGICLRRYEPLAVSLLAGPVPLLCAWVLASFSSPWRFLVLSTSLLSVVPVGYSITSNEPRPRLLRIAVGVIFVGSFTCLSYQWLLNSPDGIMDKAWWLLQGMLILATAVGCWYAFCRSWLSRNILLLLPVFIAPLPFILPWVGSFLHAVYLEEGLGIPEPAVHVAFYWRYFVALKPVALALAITLIYMSFYGWAKYFNLHVAHSFMLKAMLPLALFVVGIAVADQMVNEAQTAAERTYTAVGEGKKPPGYFGINGRLVCVRLVEPGKPIPVYPGPPPTGRPVLTFPQQGDDLWVWDPSPERGGFSTEHAVRLRTEDVSLYSATGTSCP